MIESKLKLEQFLPYKLSVLSNRISREIANDYEKEFSLTLPEWRVMAVLGENPNLSASEVSNRTAMDKVAVSRAVKKLIEGGRLIRKFAPSDKRRSIITLSKKGRDVYEKVLPVAKKYENTILSRLSLEENKQLDYLIEKLENIRLHLHELNN